MSLDKHTATPVSAEQLLALMDAAERAADAAASVTLQYFRSQMHVDNKAGGSAFDPVTLADKQAELAIREVLLQAFPDIGFYGEEHAQTVGKSGLSWVVDPIDGTRAFMSGMPLWGTLIGLFDGERAILGLMDQPFLKERFKTSADGANLHSAGGVQPLITRQGVALSAATFYCTTPDMFDTAESIERFKAVKRAVQLTRYGGDCYAYGLLAAGHIDVVLDCDLKPYDIVALIPLIEAAGGLITNWQGGSAVDGGFVVACGSLSLYEETMALLRR